MTATTWAGGSGAAVAARGPLVVALSSVGTLFVWYDFYLFSVLVAVFGQQFLPPQVDPGLAALLSLWIGFVVRPVGAVLFGHVGDRIGRKFAFVLTLSLMGAATVAIGLLPGYGTIGMLSPVLLLALRVLQGVALGGEYGSAATYVAEHAPEGKRGLYTAWVQTTATMGVVLALLAILGCRFGFGEPAFAAWAWRVPFLLSAALVLLAIYIRHELDESPLYARLREQGKASGNPARDSFSSRKNWGLIVLALFGATAPEGVVWYTGHFYALVYMTGVLGIPYATVCAIMIVALTLATPLFVVFGALSDRIGRRNLMVSGFALAAISYWPVFAWMGSFKNSPVMLGVLVFYMAALAAMVYGPIAAFLVELFPARIRCTSLSLSYQVGNGVFGGLAPVAGAAVAAAGGMALGGLIYPIGIAAIGVAVGLAGFAPRTDAVRIWREVESARPLAPEQP